MSIRFLILTWASINGVALLVGVVIAISRCLRISRVGGGLKWTWDHSIAVRYEDLSPQQRMLITTRLQEIENDA